MSETPRLCIPHRSHLAACRRPDARDVRRRGRAVRAVLRYGACRDQRGGRRGGRRVRPHSDVRFRREPERVGLGGHPALPALVAVEGERRAVAHSGDRARRNPAALDALDRARFRTHSPAGRILDRLSVARAPLSIWGGSGSGRSLEALRVRSVSLVPRSRTFSDRKTRRYLRPGIVLWLPVAGIPARCFRGPVAVACRSPFPVAGHASCKRFSTGRSEKKPRKMGYSQFLATFATRKCGSSPR